MRILLFALMAALLPHYGVAAPPAAVKATYELYRNKLFVAVIQESFAIDDGKYRIDSEATTQGLVALVKKDRITRVSTGSVTANGLRPEFFEEKRISHDKEKLVSARFDWDARKLTLSHDNKTETLPVQAGAQDISSLFYQFLFTIPNKRVVNVTVANGRYLEDYAYRFADESSVTTTAGAFQTMHYVHLSDNGERKTEIWLAKDKFLFPVRMTQEEDGNVLEQRLVALSFN